MNALLKRIREPSTQAGIASLATVATIVGVPKNLSEAIATAVTSIFGLLAVLLPENK